MNNMDNDNTAINSEASIDLSEMTEVSNVNRRSSQQFDLRYLEGQERWEVSETTFNTLRLNENGFRMFVHPTHGVILTTQNVEESTFYRGTKTQQFTARKLRGVLNSEGLTGDQFALKPVENNGTYIVEPWGDRTVSDLAITGEEDVEEDSSIPQPADTSHEERTPEVENPFT